MSKDFQDLKAWVHWKEKEKDLSEDDVLFVKDIKDLISKVGTYKARLDETLKGLDQAWETARSLTIENVKLHEQLQTKRSKK